MADVCRRLAAALLLLLALPPAAFGQATGPDADRAQAWDATATRAEKLLNDPDTSTEALETLREELVAQRADIIAGEHARQPAVDELNKRIEAIGPAPAEGAEEAPEVTKLRHQLNERLAEAQGPVLTAQEAHRRTDALMS